MTDWPELTAKGPDGQAAAYGGVWFHTLGDHPSASHALAVYEYPDRAGGEVRDLRRGVRRFRFPIAFWGDTYPDLTPFLAALEKPGPQELIHPIWGRMQAAVESVHGPNHDHRRRRFASLTVVFAQHEPRPESLKLLSQASASGQAAAARAGTAAAKSSARDKVASAARQAGLAGLPIKAQVRQSFAEGAKHVAAFGGVAGAVRRGQVGDLVGAVPGFELPEGAGSWADEPAAWCDEVDAAMLRRTKAVMALASSPTRLVRVLRAEVQSLDQAVRQAVGPQALAGVARAIPDYVRASGADAVVTAVTETLSAGLALEGGNAFEGETVGLSVEAQ